jgi:hypothetical protein
MSKVKPNGPVAGSGEFIGSARHNASHQIFT